MIERYASRLALSRAAADQFVLLSEQAMTLQGRFTVALSGGSTPRTLYEQLASAEMVSRVNWQHVFVFWGDERCVPPASSESNYRLAYESLLLHTPIPPENVFRMYGELPPERAAQEYEERLCSFFLLEPLEIPRFDLILLGLGSNGHTASLFPGTAALHEQARLVAAQYVEELHSWRITVTPPVINHAANITFLVAGAEKAEILHAVLQGPRKPDRYPAQLVNPIAGQLTWMVDADAARLLEGM